ncbi:MFS transporter [Azospirillum sp. B4]|uniref:MFS transporter n=1 Tax=Azospirillum sp. B4 TaxID=95605 RepID=UPI00034AFE62|nr:MFS transporter [Azospirillum sp. B4]
MAFLSSRDPAQARLLLLTAVLFLSYLCVAIPLPAVPVYVSGRLGLDNVCAGLATGMTFLAAIFSRGHAGGFADRRGPKVAVARGLALYVAGGLVSLAAGLQQGMPMVAYPTLLAGRLLLGLGESFVGVGVVAWGVGIVGPQRTGRVLSLVGASIYGALAVGGPVGLVLLDRVGFAGAMAVSTLLPCLGLLAMTPMAGVAPHAQPERPSFLAIMGRIWGHGLIVCLQGIGFAAIGAFFALYFLDRIWDHAGLGLTAFGGGFVLVRVLFGHLPDRIGGLTVATLSLAVEAMGQVLVWGAHGPSLALAGAFMTGLGCSLIFPSMGREVVRLVPPHLRATALGGFTAFQDLAYGLTGPLAGLMADRVGYGSVFLVGAAAAAVGMAISLHLRQMRVAAQA